MYKVTNRTKQRVHYLGWGNDDPHNVDEMDLDWEDIKTLYYEDVTLVMLSNPEGKRDLLAMEVTLRRRIEKETEPVDSLFMICAKLITDYCALQKF